MSSFDDQSFSVVNLSKDGWSTESEATATCFCGSVQLVLVSVFFLSEIRVSLSLRLYGLSLLELRSIRSHFRNPA